MMTRADTEIPGSPALFRWCELSPEDHQRAASEWLALFELGLAARQSGHVTDLFHAEGYWRDLMTFTWSFRTLYGADQLRDWVNDIGGRTSAYRFCLQGIPCAARLGAHESLDFFFTFETDVATGRGHVRLLAPAGNGQAACALTVLTTMSGLKAFPEKVGRNRPRINPGALSEPAAGLGTALDAGETEPDVLIIGAGQSGLMFAARMAQFGIRAVMVERSERVGDVWRKRYRSLKLHNDLCMNHFPYLPFPENWPVYLPKDKVADWFEFYAKAMDLEVWTGTTFESGAFDAAEGRWSARLLTADGDARLCRPRHVVMGMGVSGLPNIPTLAGQDGFAGVVMHSSGPVDDVDVCGRKAVIVGAGTSAHDIALDFHRRGADVTMVQRSPVTVVSLEPSAIRAYAMYIDNEGVRPVADVDMMAAAVPYRLLTQLHGPLSRSMQDADKDLLQGLSRAGFLLDNGEDDTGYFLKLLRRQAGYYLNIGASELIVDGRIKVKAGAGVERLTETSIILDDGTVIDADVVVLATGYEPLQEHVRRLFGDDVADRVGPIWGIGEDWELRNMYAPTAQENFFVLGGGFPAARCYSLFTALYIKAQLEGLVQIEHPIDGVTERTKLAS